MDKENICNNRYFLSEEEIKKYYENNLFPDEELKEKHWNIFILINRKGYWDYKIFYPNGAEINQDQMIVSDRYIEKCPMDELRSLFMGKNIVIYDDSLTNGSNLFYYYLISKLVGAKSIRPVVYALNSTFPSEKSKKLMIREAGRITDERFWKQYTVKELQDEFIEKLECKILLGNSDIERMSVWQTELFQKHVCPLVMDLPILNRTDGSTTPYISLKKEQLERLCNKTSDEWEFVENSLDTGNKVIQASYFRLKSKELEITFPELVHDFVVKCKYEEDNEFINVVFTPFAIVRSISYRKVFECFYALFKGSLYGDYILNNFPDHEFSAAIMEKDDHLCKAIFRAVIFRLSHYIGKKFQQYAKDVLDIYFEYDWNIMKENFNESFIKTQQKWDQEFSDKLFWQSVITYQDDDDIYPINLKDEFGEERLEANQDRINNYIRKRIIEKKKRPEISLAERIYTFETIEFELSLRFDFKNDVERRQYITNMCLAFLETNSFSNHILIDKEEHVLYRGFRYGENSEVLLNQDLWFFYPYLYAFYNNNHNVKDKFDIFMDWLKRYLEKREYLGIWISEDNFDFLRVHFSSLIEEELSADIRKKRYIFDFLKNRKEKRYRADFIDEAAQIVKQWGRA